MRKYFENLISKLVEWAKDFENEVNTDNMKPDNFEVGVSDDYLINIMNQNKEARCL